MVETPRPLPCRKQSRKAIEGCGMCAGPTFRGSGPMIAHLKAPEMRSAVGAVNEILGKHLEPLGLRWACLQLNYNSRAKPHRDENNQGMRAICIL